MSEIQIIQNTDIIFMYKKKTIFCTPMIHKISASMIITISYETQTARVQLNRADFRDNF